MAKIVDPVFSPQLGSESRDVQRLDEWRLSCRIQRQLEMRFDRFSRIFAIVFAATSIHEPMHNQHKIGVML